MCSPLAGRCCFRRDKVILRFEPFRPPSGNCHSTHWILALSYSSLRCAHRQKINVSNQWAVPGTCGKPGKLGTSRDFLLSVTFRASGVVHRSRSETCKARLTPVVCPLNNTAENALLGPGPRWPGLLFFSRVMAITLRITPILAAVAITVGPSLDALLPTTIIAAITASGSAQMRNFVSLVTSACGPHGFNSTSEGCACSLRGVENV